MTSDIRSLRCYLFGHDWGHVNWSERLGIDVIHYKLLAELPGWKCSRCGVYRQPIVDEQIGAGGGAGE